MILSLPDIHCAGCINAIETGLADLPGVDYVRVNLSRKRAVLATDLSSAEVIAHLAKMGYEAHSLEVERLDEGVDHTGRALMLRLGVAGFAMMNVMLLSVAVWSGASDATRNMFHLISAAIALPAVLFSGQPFFVNAWRAVRVGRLNMDVPISLAILLAGAMSLFETFHGGDHTYFDAALSLTFFLLIGRYLDHRSRAAARSAAQELSALELHSAQVMRDGVAQTLPLASLKLGDHVLVATGMRVPVDGRLLSDDAVTDRAFLTGESDAAHALNGAVIQAGEVNLGPAIEIEATAVGEDTTLRRIATLVETAEHARNRYTALADRAAKIYAPAVHLLALAAFLGWLLWGADLRTALNIAISVLIITCPCALGLAVPAVSTAAIGRLYGLGFLVKSGTALERLAEVDEVLVDKTGTLTQPAMDISELSHDEAAIAKSLAQRSQHPMAQAVLRALPDADAHAIADLREEPGQGMIGVHLGQPVQLGNGTWLGADFTGFGLRIGDRCYPITHRETLRPGARTAIDGLRARGLNITMLTGDLRTRAEPIAAQLGITQIAAQIDTQGKFDMVETLTAQGKHVLMIGDGLNDTAPLASAHASIAPGSALDAARNAADIVILRDDISDLDAVTATARSAVRLSRQNFAIAAAYNMVAVPIALAGLATPLLAALAMSASSLTVLANAMRVRRAK